MNTLNLNPKSPKSEANPKPKGKVVFVQAFARTFTECWEKNFGFRISDFFRISVFGLAVLFLLLFAITDARAADTPQRGRFLLVFETSPVLEKNLPELRQALGRLFSSNLQNELHAGDDVAVWTVDKDLHPGVFGTETWSPGDAATYTESLANFLKEQNFTRHASLDAMQPTLNRVVKHSERLTILIFCDTKSRLPGTPYDSGVNDIITNTAAKSNRSIPLILVLRSYRGEYIGASVNRFDSLDFPKFPPPPKPAPPPPAKPVIIPAPAPVVSSLPPLIIVGTNAGTSVDELAKQAPMPVPAPKPATNAMAPMPSASLPSPTPVQPSNSAPTPVSTTPSEPLPAPTPVPQETPSPAQTVVSTPPVAPGNPQVVQSPNAVASASKDSATEPPAADAASRWPWFIGGAACVATAGLVVWLVTRARRPRSSLITNSMQDDPRLPPRK